MSYSVGDVATLSLAVTPNDGTTAATVVVTAPDGTTSTPAVTGGPATFTAQLPLTSAGLWVATWTVTGTGQGEEQQKITVAPNGPTAAGYATTADLADWLADAPPEDADRLLLRASRLIEDYVTFPYPVNPDGTIADAEVKQALADAVCAQVEQWISVGEDNDIDGYPAAMQTRMQGRMGGVQTNARPSRLAPRARTVLSNVGLLSAYGW